MLSLELLTVWIPDSSMYERDPVRPNSGGGMQVVSCRMSPASKITLIVVPAYRGSLVVFKETKTLF